MRAFLAVPLACAVMATAASAADAKMKTSAEYDRCMKKAYSDSDMEDCDLAETARLDKSLNDVYRALLKTYDANTRNFLLDAERKWVAFRDAECDYQYQTMEGGTMAKLLYGNCELRLTQQRLQDLRDDLKAAQP